MTLNFRWMGMVRKVKTGDHLFPHGFESRLELFFTLVSIWNLQELKLTMQKSLELVCTVNVEGQRPGATILHPAGDDFLSLNGHDVLITSLSDKNKQRFAANNIDIYEVMMI